MTCGPRSSQTKDPNVSAANQTLIGCGQAVASTMKEHGLAAGVFVGMVEAEGYQAPVYGCTEAAPPITTFQASEMARILALYSDQYRQISKALTTHAAKDHTQAVKSPQHPEDSVRAG